MTTTPARRATVRALQLALVAVLATGAPAVPALATPPSADGVQLADRGDGVWDPAPAPGALVTTGEHELAATVAGRAAGATVEVRLDGVLLDSTVSSLQDGVERVRTAAPLTRGEHEVRVTTSLADGRPLERAWTVDVAGPPPRRLSGEDRVATALAIATDARDGLPAPTTAVLARADGFADALSGAPLAAHLDAPLLLTEGERLSPAVADHLADVLASGDEVVLLGGRAALSAQVEADLDALGLGTRRVAGTDRFDTAARVADELPPADRVFLASGRSFPDALAASVPAARDGHPILLTEATSLPPATQRLLEDREPADVVVVGGSGVVGPTVEAAVRSRGLPTRRVAGPDRWATAAAVAATFFGPAFADDLGPGEPVRPPPTTVALANGVRFPDALSGAQHAARRGAPLLLSPPHGLPGPTERHLGDLRPATVVVYGGPGALADVVLEQATRAANRSATAARLAATDPPAGALVERVGTIDLRFDRAVDPAAVTVHVTLGGAEVLGTVIRSDDATRLRFVADAAGGSARTGSDGLPLDVAVRTRGEDGGSAHDHTALLLRATSGPFSTVGPVTVHLPSTGVEVVGLHESTNDGALPHQVVEPSSVTWTTMPSRGRGTDPRGAADVVADPSRPVLAPVTGTVVRAGSYVLYCRYSDSYLVVAPDDRPEWEVKVLHVEGLAVGTGDRVVAGETVVARAPRLFPFRSQVDRWSSSANWPHVHVEVVDPSIPDRPSPGGGC